MSKINYVLAKDEDFEKNTQDLFIYIGKEPYIEIPHILHGKHITSYASMFEGCSFIQGVKSTNKNVSNATNMFNSRKNKSKTINLSEFDMTGIEYANGMFAISSVESIIWPKDKMPLHLKHINSMFYGLKTTTLDLSDFDFSKIEDSRFFIHELDADNIKFPKEGLVQMLRAHNPERYKALDNIEAKYQTEELCWAAVLADKTQGKHVRIKSKKILMYLGDECPEYVKFYYGKESI